MFCFSYYCFKCAVYYDNVSIYTKVVIILLIYEFNAFIFANALTVGLFFLNSGRFVGSVLMYCSFVTLRYFIKAWCSCSNFSFGCICSYYASCCISIVFVATLSDLFLVDALNVSRYYFQLFGRDCFPFQLLHLSVYCAALT